MKANELRIGNYVGTYNDGEEDKTFIVSPPNIQVELKANKQGYTRYRPIQLTEEWFIKWGYECMSECLCDMEEKMFDYLGIKADLRNDFVVPCIENLKVHEFQNLFKSLTGEELTIKNQNNENNNPST